MAKRPALRKLGQRPTAATARSGIKLRSRARRDSTAPVVAIVRAAGGQISVRRAAPSRIDLDRPSGTVELRFKIRFPSAKGAASYQPGTTSQVLEPQIPPRAVSPCHKPEIRKQPETRMELTRFRVPQPARRIRCYGCYANPATILPGALKSRPNRDAATIARSFNCGFRPHAFHRPGGTTSTMALKTPKEPLGSSLFSVECDFYPEEIGIIQPSVAPKAFGATLDKRTSKCLSPERVGQNHAHRPETTQTMVWTVLPQRSARR